MTEQEQIEEMAKVIDDRLIEARGWLGSMNRGEGYWIAQKLVEHYQPKIPESSVVLSREEYSELKAENDKYVKDCIDYIATISKLENKVWEVEQQASKETAEQDFNTIIKALEERKDRVKAFYGVAESVGVDIAIRTVKELAKQFNVEIKE